MSLNAPSLSVKRFTGFEGRYQQPDKGQLWVVDICSEITRYRWPLLTSCKNVKFQEMPAFETSHVKVAREKKRATSVESVQDKGNIMKQRK